MIKTEYMQNSNMEAVKMKAADLTLDLLGERVAVQIILDCPYDANHSRMRG